jgi:biopolymer transport protein ExbD
MAGGGGGEGDPEFQIAPMIDVLLVLLIFFMSITTAQVLKVDKSIKLPLAPDAIKKDTQRSEVMVNVRWNPLTKKASYVVDDKIFLETGELIKAVAEAKKIGETRVTKSANPTFRAVVRGDRDVPATYIARAMNAAAESGISDISFSAVNKD